MKKFLNEKTKFLETGTIMLPKENNIFSLSELNLLEKLSDSLPREHVEVGDANEPNFLDVGRIMTDIQQPVVVNKEISVKALEILNAKEKMAFFKYILGKNKLYIRRVQYNILKENSFVGIHLDTDSNPDYLVAVVLQFGGEFQGGDYVVYGGGLPPRSFHPHRYSMIISDCRYEHEVTKIKKGIRKSLVFFLSSNNGKNTRKN